MTRIIRREDVERFEAAIRSNEISPELVLVDPELALVARAAWAAPPEKVAVPGPRPAELESQREPEPTLPSFYLVESRRPTVLPVRRTRSRGGLVRTGGARLLSITAPGLLFGSLLVNLALAGVILGGSDLPYVAAPDASTQRSSALLQSQAPKQATGSKRQAAARAGHRPSARNHVKPGAIAKAMAARTVLGLVQVAPRSRITKLLDRKTGLLKNNVQAVCRRRTSSGPAGLLCVVRSAGAPRGAGLYVRYVARPGGRWSVTWLGYRNGSRREALR